MNLTNVEIARVIAHEVVRASQVEDRPPILSDGLVTLDDRGKDLVAKRIVETIASGSHCVDVCVEDDSVGSPFDCATSMLDVDDVNFVSSSRHLAESLTNAQTAGPIKSGSAIFVQGTCNADGSQSRFLSIIKADSDQALFKQVRELNISLTFVNDMLLGDSQRLIKIAFFIEEDTELSGERRKPEEFSVKVYDHLLQRSSDSDAAAYFYRAFLKCRKADSAPQQTRRFFEVARNFISTLPLPQSERVELHGDLISYLRQDLSVLEPRRFARDVLPQDKQDEFVSTCRKSGITQAISKDLTLLKGRLRRQSLKFSSKVTIYASPEVMKSAVKITGESGDGWTDVRIRGSIEEIP